MIHPGHGDHDLGPLLRSWRARVQPAEVGSPFDRGTRKTPGLRREEVAWLAGVSTDYVKRLEQGRAHPSATVLRAICRALRLSTAEYQLACRLAGLASTMEGQLPRHISPSVRRLLDRFTDAPIAVFDAAWTCLEPNRMWIALMGESQRSETRSSNIVWQTFCGNQGRVRHNNPDDYRRSLVADLRDVVSRYPQDRELTKLIRDLQSSSPEFINLWALPNVGQHATETKIVEHPEVGPIELDCDVLTMHGLDQRIILFTAAADSDAADKLSFLSVLGTQAMDASLFRDE